MPTVMYVKFFNFKQQNKTITFLSYTERNWLRLLAIIWIRTIYNLTFQQYGLILYKLELHVSWLCQYSECGIPQEKSKVNCGLFLAILLIRRRYRAVLTFYIERLTSTVKMKNKIPVYLSFIYFYVLCAVLSNVHYYVSLYFLWYWI